MEKELFRQFILPLTTNRLVFGGGDVAPEGSGATEYPLSTEEQEAFLELVAEDDLQMKTVEERQFEFLFMELLKESGHKLTGKIKQRYDYYTKSPVALTEAIPPYSNLERTKKAKTAVSNMLARAAGELNKIDLAHASAELKRKINTDTKYYFQKFADAEASGIYKGEKGNEMYKFMLEEGITTPFADDLARGFSGDNWYANKMLMKKYGKQVNKDPEATNAVIRHAIAENTGKWTGKTTTKEAYLKKYGKGKKV